MDDNLIEWMLYSTTSSKNVVVPIAEIKNKDYSPYEVCIKDQSDHFGKILGVGSYLCELVIWDSKDNIEFQKHRKHFKVNAIKPFVEWMEKEQYVKTQDN
jgi:hypothetical protein